MPHPKRPLPGDGMPRIAVTGHMTLTPATETLIEAALRELLAAESPDELVGVSCLAKGADQLLARTVLERGGRLIAVLPSPNYRAQKVKPDNRAIFDELLAQASEVRTMPFAESNRQAYEAANNTFTGASRPPGGGLGRPAKQGPRWYRRGSRPGSPPRRTGRSCVAGRGEARLR